MYCIAGACWFAHFIFALNRQARIAGPLGLALIGWLFIRVAVKTNYFRALAIALFGFLASGLLLNILAEFTGRFLTSPAFISLLLGFLLVGIEVNSRQSIPRLRDLLTFATLWTLTTSLWILALSVDVRAFITFLGYGYDNAAHFTLGRMILDHGHSFLLSNDSLAGPTFLQDAAQLGGTTFSLTATIMGIDNSNIQGVLATFSVMTLAIPALAISSVVAGTQSVIQKHKAISFLLVLVGSSVFIVTGYLSRIWLSGYLNSNIGTLCLVVLAVHVSIGPKTSLPLLVVGVCVMVHSYPLHIGFGFALLLPALSRWFGANLSLNSGYPSTQVFRLVFGAALLFATWIFPFRATRRSYGGAQFLAEGGIEPFPSKWFFVLCVLAVPILWIIAQGQDSRAGLLSLVLIVCVALISATYSIAKVEKIAYYPTKLLVACVLATFVSMSVSILQVRSDLMKLVAIVVFGLITLTYGVSQPRESVFTSPFMGDFPQSIKAARNATPVVVEGGRIYKLALQSEYAQKPILYLGRDQDSELNTRWINAISGFWTDESWTAWMQSRTALTANGGTQDTLVLADDGMIVVTDISEVASRVQSFENLDLCLIQDTAECG